MSREGAVCDLQILYAISHFPEHDGQVRMLTWFIISYQASIFVCKKARHTKHFWFEDGEISSATAQAQVSYT
jgi:hypothetical protein